jgi:hypothetical protein
VTVGVGEMVLEGDGVTVTVTVTVVVTVGFGVIEPDVGGKEVGGGGERLVPLGGGMEEPEEIGSVGTKELEVGGGGDKVGVTTTLFSNGLTQIFLCVSG